MKIGVIGLGLIGGSIFKELKSKSYDIVAVSNSQNGENIFKTYEVLKDCDLVFVCSPMNKNLKILDDLVSEKFNWREEILKQQIPENILEFLGYLEDDDCCNLYIKEIKEI